MPHIHVVGFLLPPLMQSKLYATLSCLGPHNMQLPPPPHPTTHTHTNHTQICRETSKNIFPLRHVQYFSSLTPSIMNSIASPTQGKPSRGGWNAAIFIIFVEVAQQFAFYGLASNLIMYLTNVLDQPLATAAKNVNAWLGVSSVFPVLGAFVADSYLGRFTTILFSITICAPEVLSSIPPIIPMNMLEADFFY